MRARLSRRCLHFEQILLRVIEENPWPRVLPKLTAAVGCDEGLLARRVLLENTNTTKSDATRRLKESIARLHADTGELFESMG